MLRKITNLQAWHRLHQAGRRRQLTSNELDQCRLTGAIATEQTDTHLWPQAQADSPQHIYLTVANTGLIELDQRIGQLVGSWKLEVHRRTGVHRSYDIHTSQRFESALCLPCLGRFGPKPIYETLNPLDLALLALVSRRLLGRGRSELRLEGMVATPIEPRRRPLQIHDIVHHSFQKRLIMGDDDQGPGVGLQPALEPDHCFQIEMVGGLVEQQQIRSPHECLRQI